MAFGGLEKKPHATPMADINMTPLIDVMLVLLVIFIITAPLFTHAIRLNLPQVNAAPDRQTAQTITLSIDAAGRIYWNGAVVSAGEMRARLNAAAHEPAPPELQLRAERSTRYDVIASVMGAAQDAGLAKIGFVTQPAAVQAAQSSARGAP